MAITRSEITSWLYGDDVEKMEAKNPVIIITDGTQEYSILSIYNGDEKTPTIYIDIRKIK